MGYKKYSEIVFLITMIFFVPACRVIRQSKAVDKRSLWAEKEAKLYDIPVMLNARPYYGTQSYFVSQGSDEVLAYTISHKNLDEIVLFYSQEMERLGWQIIKKFYAYEVFLYFQKPLSACAVSIRSFKTDFLITVFMQREGEAVEYFNQ